MAKWTARHSRYYPTMCPAVIDKVCSNDRIQVTFTKSFHDSIKVNHEIDAADFAVGTSCPQNWLTSQERDARLPRRLDEMKKNLFSLSKVKRKNPSLDRIKLDRCA